MGVGARAGNAAWQPIRDSGSIGGQSRRGAGERGAALRLLAAFELLNGHSGPSGAEGVRSFREMPDSRCGLRLVWTILSPLTRVLFGF